MKDTTVRLKAVIKQGASFELPLVRRYLPYGAEATPCGGVTNTCTGEPVLPTDYLDEDYTGCTAVLQVRREVGDPDLLFSASTLDGSIFFQDNKLTVSLSAAMTDLLDFDRAIGHIEVTRPSGEVNRQYEVEFTFSPAVVV